MFGDEERYRSIQAILISQAAAYPDGSTLNPMSTRRRMPTIIAIESEKVNAKWNEGDDDDDVLFMSVRDIWFQKFEIKLSI